MDKSGNPISSKINLNFCTLTKFIEPAGVCVLLNAAKWLQSKNVDVLCTTPECIDCTSHKHPVRYLDDVGFFRLYIGKSLFNTPAKIRRALPVTVINFSEAYQYLESKLIPCIDDWFGINTKKVFQNSKCVLKKYLTISKITQPFRMVVCSRNIMVTTLCWLFLTLVLGYPTTLER